MLTRRGFAGVVAASTLSNGAFARSAAAEQWPARHVRIIVPFVPGGATDVIARVMGNRLSQGWGQQVVVENRGGGGANIGAQAAAQSDPDGYTLYITSVPHATNRFLYSSLNYDPVADFAPDGDLVIAYLADAVKWPMDPRTWERFACNVAGRDLTPAEWDDILPDRNYQHVCPP